MTLKPIFTSSFLSDHLADFKLASIPGIRTKKAAIDDLIAEINSGKIHSLKEEELKSRFINTIFGDVLGFNYGNPNYWHLREEKKSSVDGTKPDAAIGDFLKNKTGDTVKGIIEIKDANTDLDAIQKRRKEGSAVDQAFSYVAKMRGACKWVIVSNFLEIRFYPSLDRSRCQIFQLKELNDEVRLKEFLFLFHKDRLISESSESRTDKLLRLSEHLATHYEKPVHIVDKIYSCLKRFESFGFVDPNYIATLYPFNILEEHVWHYHDNVLFTNNNEVYDLLQEITITGTDLVFSDHLKRNLKGQFVVEGESKLKWSFEFLNYSMITEIRAVRDYKQLAERNKRTIGFSSRHITGITEKDVIAKEIFLVEDRKCNCISCSFRTLDLNAFLKTLKSSQGHEHLYNLELAYGNYYAATNNFKAAYNIYKFIEKETKGKEGKEVTYFFAKLNILHLHNLIVGYPYDDGKDILDDIKAIDLDKVIYDEIEFAVDNDVKRYLIKVKEDDLIYRVQDNIDELILKVEKLKKLYANSGKQTAGPNLPNYLSHEYFKLYLHLNRNFIVHDSFNRYRSLTEKVFRALVTCYHLPENNLQQFTEFHLTEAILHIHTSTLSEILENTEIIKTTAECGNAMLAKLNAFLSSHYTDGMFADPRPNNLLTEHNANFYFSHKISNIAAGLFVILSKLDIDRQQFETCKKSLIKFLKVESELPWSDLSYAVRFIESKGFLFDQSELEEILKIGISSTRQGSIKYREIIEVIPLVLKKFYPDYTFDNIHLAKTALLFAQSEDGRRHDLAELVPLASVSSGKSREQFEYEFRTQLEARFDPDLYEKLLWERLTDFNEQDYFHQYTLYVERSKSMSYEHGVYGKTNLIFFNYAMLVYDLGICFDRAEFSMLSNLNNFEQWLISPDNFDYSKFDAKWLLDSNVEHIFRRLTKKVEIRQAIDLELKKEYNAKLAEVRYRYFANS